MKILDRKTFLNMPSGTIYSKFTPQIFFDFSVKVSSPEDGWGNDWVHIPLVESCFIKDSDTNDINPEDYDHFEFDLDCTVRDGCFDEDQLFAVYEREDILKLVNKLIYPEISIERYDY